MSFRYPLNDFTLTQGFGGNAAYYKQFGQSGHNGIDMGAPAGTPVFAADDGTVAFEGWGQNHSWMGVPAGICVLINHGGSYAGYAHMTSTVISKGQRVAKGQHIGYVGSTGAATGPHLHFEMLPLSPNFNNGYAGRMNVTPYIEARSNITRDQIVQAYREILEREADEGGINTYLKNGMNVNEVRNDLTNSAEKRTLEQNKANAAIALAAQQAREAEDARIAAAAKAAAEAAQAELERIALEEAAAQAAVEQKANDYAVLTKENNTLLKQILSVVQTILEKITGVFK